jgi:cyclic pyranopterin phosphate synthase
MEITTPSRPWGDKSSFKMIDVGAKVATQRRAIAQGSIELAENAFVAIKNKTNPKGDVLALAEVAGIMAAKKTADYIPLCHPLPLDYVRLSFELNATNKSVLVFCEAGTTAKTGVEMEALAGVNGALLTIYDLSKAVNPQITISNIHLVLKEGGKSGSWTPEKEILKNLKPFGPLENVKCAVLTVSDRISSGVSKDFSGPLLLEKLKLCGATLLSHKTVSDDQKNIQEAVINAIQKEGAEIVFTTGGTGLSPRDVTPDALEEICDRKINGIGELLRSSGSKRIQTAWLSRSTAFIVDQSIVLTLPGSPNAVSEGLEVVLPIISHAIHTLRGGNHD